MPDLQRLQEELLALKAAHPELRLRKAPAGAAGAPFPIVVTCPITAPIDASTIDVDTFKVQATINNAQPGSTTTATSAAADDVSINLEIVSSELPDVLKRAMAADLQAQMATTPPDGTLLRLGPVLAAASKGYARLVTLLPDCLERYEAVDAAGRTVRRIAILKDVEVTIDAAPHHALVTSPQTASAAPAPGPALPRALQAELEALKKRHAVEIRAAARPSSEAAAATLRDLSINEGEEKPTTIYFRVSMTPTDPQWVPQGSLLALQCAVLDAGAYPAPGSFALSLDDSHVLGPISRLSELEREVFNRLLEVEVAGAAGRPGALRAALRQCENRAGELIHQAEDIAMEIERRRGAAAAGAGGAESGSEGSEEGYSYSSEGDSEEHSGSERSSYSDSDAERDEEDEAAAIGGSGGGGDGALVHNSLNLCLEGLQMVEVDTLDAVKLTLQLHCLRCRAGAEATLAAIDSGAARRLGWTGECLTCHATLGLTVALRIVHEGSNVLAAVRPEGCAPADLLPSTFAAQCSACSSMAAFRGAQVGRWNERDCSHCHRRMSFLLPSVAFTPATAGGGGRRGGVGGGAAAGSTDPSGGAGPRSRSDRDVLITPGQPLPDNGTCRHYRHSHRWLRFPCCGRRFPCDLCHEEGTEDGHEMKWAGRMVCGYCSVEQPLGERCSVCERRLASSAARPSGRNTKFWEGGEGQRDKKRLSRKDPHKWAGSKAKTQSRKSQRVGQKGKERAERKKK